METRRGLTVGPWFHKDSFVLKKKKKIKREKKNIIKRKNYQKKRRKLKILRLEIRKIRPAQ